MNLTLRENYWDSPELKQEFMSFMIELFRLDLSPWDKAGFWDWRYRPFSYFKDTTLVSNVCVYSMELTVNGEKRSVAQISAVGTIPEYRRKGLSRTLTHTALDWAKSTHDFFFLFADDDAFPFYRECGFRLTQEYKARISAPETLPRPGAVQLDIQRPDHLELVYRLASGRKPVSDTLGVTNSRLFMFWCLTYLKDCIHYVPDLDLVVLFKRESGLVTMFDIVGPTMPTFAEIYPYICAMGDQTIDFLFMVDKMKLKSFDYIEVLGNGTHLRGEFPLETTRFLFPFTAHA